MSVKLFDINRLICIPKDYEDCAYRTYICPDDVVGINLREDLITGIYTTGGHVNVNTKWSLAEFEAEVERAVKQTMEDQNAHLGEFKIKLNEHLEKARLEAETMNKTDKIADYN